MTQTVLPQLKEIASDLAAQEAALVEQLDGVRDKLNGVRAVLPLFGDSIADFDLPATDEAKPAAKAKKPAASTKKADASADSSKSSSATAEREAENSDEVEGGDEADAAEVSSTADKNADKKVRKTTVKKVKSGKKKDGRTASWQKFTRPGVKEKTVPEAVRLVLETQPDKSFKIAEVMSSLFKDDMPKQQYLKARNRISNILSGGVRDGEWYKGDRGTYSLMEQ